MPDELDHQDERREAARLAARFRRRFPRTAIKLYLKNIPLDYSRLLAWERLAGNLPLTWDDPEGCRLAASGLKEDERREAENLAGRDATSEELFRSYYVLYRLRRFGINPPPPDNPH